MRPNRVIPNIPARSGIVWWSAFLLWTIFVFWLSSLTANELKFLPHAISRFDDKVLHGFLFCVGSILLTMAMRQTIRSSWIVVLFVSVSALSLFGLSDEIHQLFTSGRSGCDWGDWMADCLGVVLGATLVFLMYRGSQIRGSNCMVTAKPPS